MRTLINSFFALLLGFVMMPDMAEAKRLGGGSSFGKSYSTPQRTAPTPTREQTATTSTAKTGTTATGTKSKGFGGLMGGLLAGGLLAALFMGGAFEGIQIMDILLIAVIGFVLFKLFARRKVQQPQPAYATPDGGMMHQETEPQAAAPQSPVFSGASNAALASSRLNLPEWFNEKAFVEGAQQHFIHLQKAWDTQDWSEIRDYMSEEMFASLQQERAKLPDQQHTEVDSVMAELVNFIDEGDHVVASIHFYGWIAESGQPTSEFSEVWHLNRNMQVAGADWKIVGIEQAG
ncbi:Tim44 domain-containing protein [Marinobacterium sediminicola]|uniref:Predicted lipid-binding transport protein, Tim44 family n=1 Tax=Marinobacterium sediminicola TaxID=518898 RepID=A0ABY1RWR8_9GAMM|nr:TIM44-like domain-containing protein [Marinobacterium sediminicola]ULG70248.1 TIM44-like domain-containing protein [Marinobacterium sediminicola]SMR69968.1 Predicted lipid-binding transport protein, Tim44 family [Marinobacterium sediminicola]